MHRTMYQPHPMQAHFQGKWRYDDAQESGGWVVIECSASKTSLGWINRKLQLLLWMSTGAYTDDGWRLWVMCSGCRHLKEHICLTEGMTLPPIDTIGWWTPWPMQLLMELGHGLQNQKGGCNGYVPLCVRICNELTSSTLMQSTPTQSKRDPCYQLEGGHIPSLHWMRSINTTTAPELDDSRGTRACLQNGG